MTFTLTPVEEQRVADLSAAFGCHEDAARLEVMLEAGYPMIADVIPIDAACTTCGKPIGRGGLVFYSEDGKKPYCRRHADAEVRRLTGGRGL